MAKVKRPRINIIAAIGKNRELGKKNELVWRIPNDLKRVKKLTVGHPLIMGRKTFESIGKPLPDRTNIVISQSNVCIDGCLTYKTLHDAVEAAKAIDEKEIFIFGGASIYEASLLFADRLYLTVVDCEDKGADVYFPAYEHLFAKVVKESPHPENNPPFTWLILER